MWPVTVIVLWASRPWRTPCSRLGWGETMIIYKAPDEFLVRFYRWSCADFRREIDQGFPLFGLLVPDLTVYRLLALMESLPPARQTILASALLKRSHARAVEILGEQQSEEEKHHEELFINAMGAASHFETTRWQSSKVPGSELDRKERKLLLVHVKKEFNKPEFSWKGNSFELEEGAFRLITRFFTGMTGTDLCYEHAIKNIDMGYYGQNMIFYCEQMSILAWLGISLRTMWANVRLQEVEQIGKGLILLCKHFIDGVGSLLEETYLDPSRRFRLENMVWLEE